MVWATAPDLLITAALNEAKYELEMTVNSALSFYGVNGRNRRGSVGGPLGGPIVRYPTN